MYCADHSAPTKSSALYFKNMANEMEEYYQQGDLERKLEFTVTPFFDRATCNPFKYQLGYIDVIAQPLFETWCDFLPQLRETLLVEGIEANRRLVQQKIDETKSIMESQPPQSLSKSAAAKLDQTEPATPGKEVQGEESKDAAVAVEPSAANQAQGKDQNNKGSVASGNNSEVRQSKSSGKRSAGRASKDQDALSSK